MRTWRFILLVCLGIPWFTMAASRDEQWRAVSEAMDKGLPQSAIAALQPILAETRQENAHAEFVKALALQVVLETRVQGNLPEEGIRRLQTAMTNAPAPAQPLLETLLGHAYWNYFQRYRWQFLQRTTTGQSPGDDFTTWDLPRILNEIDSHFQKALANPQLLQQTPIAQFDALLNKGTLPDSYRPTLYDFIAHEAIKFYSAGERAATLPEDQVELDAAKPIFDPAPDFLAWQFDRTATNSPVVRALQIFHDLLAFHQNDAERSAFLDADLARLLYGGEKAVGENKTARYQTALERFVAQAGNHSLAAVGLFHWATSLQSEENFVRAREIAQRGVAQFADTAGGKLCRNLIAQIEAPALNLVTEEVWNTDPVTIRLTYKNLTRVHFRAVSMDWQQLLSRGREPESLDDNQRRELLAKQPVLNWSVELPATADYKQRVHEISAPQAELKPGFYFILASPNPAFPEQDNPITYTTVWVSQLAIIHRARAGFLEGFVLQAESGEPIPGAELRVWRQENRWVPLDNVRTDTNGFFSLKGNERPRYLILAQHQGQQLAVSTYARLYPEESRPEEFTFFFTDRSLYRPGQMVQYKGICVHADRKINDYTTLKGRTLTVIFADANGQEVARQNHQCNEQGSFSGTFNIPTGRLTGAMSFRVENGPSGATSFQVEEYKRPRFKVVLNSPTTPAALNKEVTLNGRAETYTGAAVDNASLRYRVVRQVRWPVWRRWFAPGPEDGPKEIAHGTARTEADGSFHISFPAQPPPDAKEKDAPTFRFEVSVDVTDNSGETRSDTRTVVVGFTTFQANLNIDEWQTVSAPVAIRIQTTTLDGEPQAAEGTLKIHNLKEPEKVKRPELLGPKHDTNEDDGSDPYGWEIRDVIAEQPFTTNGKGEATNTIALGRSGLYLVMLESRDANGRPVTARALISVLDPEARQFNTKLPHIVAAPKWSLEPGSDFVALWGTGYDSGRAFVEIEHRNQFLRRFWTEPGRTQQQIQQAITESMRGGFTLHVTQVRHNRAHLTSHHVDVPWTNKQLKIRWEHFVSKLKPGGEETWTAVITGPDAMPAVAETVAALYDASLDAFAPHQWQQQFGVFYYDYSSVQPAFVNQPSDFNVLVGHWNLDYVGVDLTYRHFPHDLLVQGGGVVFARGRGLTTLSSAGSVMAFDAKNAMPAAAAELSAAGGLGGGAGLNEALAATNSALAQKLDQVSARKNLNETAFFFPQLIANKDGEVRLQFTMPEALTEWRFLAFAHDTKLRSGFLEDNAVTSKDIMIRPNPPRFLREGDTLEFTATVLNQSPTRQTGRVRLTFSDAATGGAVDLKIPTVEQSFDIPAHQSAGFSWRLQVSDGLGILAYKAVAATELLSDGEEGYLPVIPRKILVTESLPLPIRGPGTKEFTFTNLLQSAAAKTVQHQSLTVQMASQPGWYAVLALPYLMEFPHECTEQTFNRYYANALARTIATSNPKIQRVFELWKNTPALDSPLEKNEELKNLALEATPWVREAQSESQARRRIGLLFDQNRVRDESNRILQKLQEQQRPDGAWPWFPGGDANHYITLYITTGFGRLRHLGVDTPIDPAVRALDYLDHWLTERHRQIVKAGTEKENNLSSSIALHLYTRSFFLKDKPVAAENKPALDYFIGQARQYWLKLDPRQSKAHLALGLHRFGPAAASDTPQAIMRSIKEHAVTDEELGMYWRDTEHSWHWDRAPIETQALMVEAFDEIMADAPAVEACRVWLLKQKQTQGWKTTKSTADAVYALLLRGANLLASDEIVQVNLDGKSVDPGRVEPGTGFYEQRFAGSDVKASLAHVTVAKKDQGVAWGSVHWQYFQDVGEVGAATGTPLKVEKTLHTRKLTNQGPVLEPVAGPISVGDELIVRVVVRVDRDMEYVHLKDQRGSGTEPVNVLSGYRWQDGLGYYESTRDTASHFFVAYLAKGTYVFEYPTRVVHRGEYQSGLAEIQCMYAPEFNSHSASQKLVVK